MFHLYTGLPLGVILNFQKDKDIPSFSVAVWDAKTYEIRRYYIVQGFSEYFDGLVQEDITPVH